MRCPLRIISPDDDRYEVYERCDGRDRCDLYEPYEPTCSICIESIKPDDVLGSTTTSCGHVFHSTCLERHKNQAILDSTYDGTELITSMNHHGFHCPNCREKLETSSESPRGLWYERPSSEAARTALLSMYTALLSIKKYEAARPEYKLLFVQRCEDRARKSSEFDGILSEQQEAQRKFATIDRNNESESWRAYVRLSRSTARMLTFYLSHGDLDHELIRPLVDAWLSENGLKHPLIS